jgi:hypothetical protein
MGSITGGVILSPGKFGLWDDDKTQMMNKGSRKILRWVLGMSGSKLDGTRFDSFFIHAFFGLFNFTLNFYFL